MVEWQNSGRICMQPFKLYFVLYYKPDPFICLTGLRTQNFQLWQTIYCVHVLLSSMSKLENSLFLSMHFSGNLKRVVNYTRWKTNTQFNFGTLNHFKHCSKKSEVKQKHITCIVQVYIDFLVHVEYNFVDFERPHSSVARDNR